jgi:hypothetical protein
VKIKYAAVKLRDRIFATDRDAILPPELSPILVTNATLLQRNVFICSGKKANNFFIVTVIALTFNGSTATNYGIEGGGGEGNMNM